MVRIYAGNLYAKMSSTSVIRADCTVHSNDKIPQHLVVFPEQMLQAGEQKAGNGILFIVGDVREVIYNNITPRLYYPLNNNSHV